MRRSSQALLLLLLVAITAFTVGRTTGEAEVFIVILAEQPVETLAETVGAPYRAELAMLSERARAVAQRARPGGVVADLSLERQAAATMSLDAAAGQELKQLNRAADDTLHAMRQAVLAAALPDLERTQLPVIGLFEAAGGQLLYRYRVVNAVAARLPETAVAALRAQSEVAAVIPDQGLSSHLDVSVESLGAGAWWINDLDGGLYDVAVVDTGIDRSHPALLGHMVIEDVFLEAAGEPYWDATADDVSGHGTNVAGIISSGDPVYRGVAFGHDTLINLKAGYVLTDSTDGGPAGMYWSDAMAAVDWALTQEHDPEVINLSFGACAGSGDSPFDRFWDAVVDQWFTAAAISAGNDGVVCIHSPSIAYNGYSVANADDRNTLWRSDDLLYGTSSRGPAPDNRKKPDLAAPGTGITSANNRWEGWEPDWVAYTGTSQAAPHVAGGILLAADAGVLDPRAQKALLINTATDRGGLGWDSDWGWGYLDLAHAYFHTSDVRGRSIGPGEYELYVGPFFDGDRATLVWNRHVDYAGAQYPPITGTYGLNDLDLYLYERDTNLLTGASISAMDNVEQVRAGAEYFGVLRVQAAPLFSGVDNERYALATEDGFERIQNVPQPSTIGETVFRGVSPSAIQVTLPVTNVGDLALFQVTVYPVIPAGVELVEGSAVAFLGTLAPGESRSAEWTFRITNGMFHLMSVQVQGRAYGVEHAVDTVVELAFNNAPSEPSILVPSDGATDVTLTPALAWTGGDPDQDELTYSVSFGETNPPPIAASTLLTTWSPGGLDAHTTYFWSITASDGVSETAGPVWSFGTLNRPPSGPTDPDPPDGSVGVSLTPSLSWAGGDPDGDLLTYTVSLGTQEPPTVSTVVTEALWSPGALLPHTSYHWLVSASDGLSETIGSIWSFTTENRSPYPPSLPSPYDGETGVSLEGRLAWAGGDPDDDLVTHTVYLDTQDPPQVVAGVTQDTFWDYGPLVEGTELTWQIVAGDGFGGLSTGPAWDFTSVTANPRPPSQPTHPTPGDGATGVPLTAALAWDCSDPNGDVLTYTVAIGHCGTALQVASGITETHYDPGPLDAGLTYCWVVTATDGLSETAGPAWQFTSNAPPYEPSSPAPPDGAEHISLRPLLSWTGGDPDGDTVTYTVAIGIESSPPVVGVTEETWYAVSLLEEETTYTWRVTAVDELSQTDGEAWSFTTGRFRSYLPLVLKQGG